MNKKNILLLNIMLTVNPVSIFAMNQPNHPLWNASQWKGCEKVLIQKTENSCTYQWLPKGTNPSENSWSISGTESSESSWIKKTERNFTEKKITTK